MATPTSPRGTKYFLLSLIFLLVMLIPPCHPCTSLPDWSPLSIPDGLRRSRITVVGSFAKSQILTLSNKYLFLSLLFLLFVLVPPCHACTPLSDWSPLSIPDILQSSRITVVGSFAKFRILTLPEEVFHVKYELGVQCVMHNEYSDKLQVGWSINVTSVRFGSPNSISSCEGYYWQIQYHRQAIVMLKPSPYVTGDFAFDFINLQGPYFYIDELKDREVNAECQLVSAAHKSRGTLIGLLIVVILVELVIGTLILS